MRPLAQASVDQFAALGDATRVRVLELLSEKSRPVHDLAAAFDISRPAISRHLRVLKEAGLVKEEKQGRENLYALQRAPLKPLLEWLDTHRANPARQAKTQRPKSATAKAKAAAPVPARKAKPVMEKAPHPAAPSSPAPQIAFDF